jgi:hypothetical protein
VRFQTAQENNKSEEMENVAHNAHCAEILPTDFVIQMMILTAKLDTSLDHIAMLLYHQQIEQ